MSLFVRRSNRSATLPPKNKQRPAKPEQKLTAPSRGAPTKRFGLFARKKNAPALPVPFNPAMSQEALRKHVVTAQLRPRLSRSDNMAVGAVTGMAVGVTTGLVVAIAAAVPSCGGSIVAIPLGGLGGWVIGGAVGLASDVRRPVSDFGNVRRGLMTGTGICATPKDSARLIRRLKAAGVLERGHNRTIKDLRPLHRIAPSDFGLSARKVTRLTQVLAAVQIATPHYNALVARKTELTRHLEQVSKKKMPSLHKDLESQIKQVNSQMRHFGSRPPALLQN